MKIKSDENLNPQLRKQVQEVRGMINKGENSSRFEKVPCDNRPAYRIIDKETQREVEVPLCSLADVMYVLVKLFE